MGAPLKGANIRKILRFFFSVTMTLFLFLFLAWNSRHLDKGLRLPVQFVLFFSSGCLKIKIWEVFYVCDCDSWEQNHSILILKTLAVLSSELLFYQEKYAKDCGVDLTRRSKERNILAWWQKYHFNIICFKVTSISMWLDIHHVPIKTMFIVIIIISEIIV